MDFPTKRFLQIALLLHLITIGFLHPPAAQTTARIITRIDGTVLTTDSLTDRLRALMQAARVEGLAVTVLNNNRVVYKRAFGYANKTEGKPLSTAAGFYGASLSKALFATVVMKLAEQGRLDLDRPLQQYLDRPAYEYSARDKDHWASDFTDLRDDTRYHLITARMCLTHTSGFPNWRWYEPDRRLRVLFRPGQQYRYSGEGFGYLQFVIEKITGKSIDTLAKEMIFRPAGMVHSGFLWRDSFGSEGIVSGHDTAGVPFPFKKYTVARAGSTLQTSADDYSRFLENLLQGKLLGPAALNEMFRPQLRIHSYMQFPDRPENDKDTTLNDAIRLGYGLGWGVLSTPYGHGVFKEGHGTGFQHYCILFPEKKTGILLMANSDNAESIFRYLLETAIADRYTPWEWEKYVPYDRQPGKR